MQAYLMIFLFVIALLTLIAIHEYGHFLAARICGVKVEEFSIGFGKSLWKKKDEKGTLYNLKVIPLGGYVRMLDGRYMHLSEKELPRAFNQQSLLKRIIIIAAGPLINFLLAFVLFWVMFTIGTEELKPIIGKVLPNSIAAKAGMHSQQEILSIGGQTTPSWNAAQLAFINHYGLGLKQLPVEVRMDNGTSQKLYFDLSAWVMDPRHPKILTTLGLQPYRPPVERRIGNVIPGGLADQAGLKRGDEIISINSHDIQDWYAIMRQIRKTRGDLRIIFQRGSEVKKVLIPAEPSLRGRRIIGIEPLHYQFPTAMLYNTRLPFYQSWLPAAQEVANRTLLTFKFLYRMITGKISMANLSGPISIVQGAEHSAKQGLVYFIGFLALISVSLGVVNLLPIPVLDGGQLLLLFLEGLRGRPLSLNAQRWAVYLGGALIGILTIIAVYNDILRL